MYNQYGDIECGYKSPQFVVIRDRIEKSKEINDYISIKDNVCL